MTPTDPLFASQWHFTRIGNIQRVWDDYSGAGVHVGVYDSGIQYSHHDLNDNYDPGRHVTYDGVTYDGAPLDLPDPDGHGTSVAGLIAAEKNGTGGVGVAWGADLTSVPILKPLIPIAASPFAPWGFWAALEQSTSFDVVNHSWGTEYEDFRPYQDASIPDGFTGGAVAAWAEAAALGRGGLGTVVVKAAGNNHLNSNADGMDASRFTVTVAATRADGFAASYSNHGGNVLVSAPGGDGGIFVDGPGLVTTDMLGGDGYSPGDHVEGFGGTSASAPIVAGVVALMLDAAPGLGWRDVQDILAASATHTGSAVGAGTLHEYEDHGWFFNGAADWNGGGMHFSENYGYGLVDAYAAVRMAEVWHLFTPAAQTSANEAVRSTGQVNAGRAIPDLGTASFRFDVRDATELDHASLTLSVSHQAFSDLRIWLVSPGGTEVMIADGSNGWGTGGDGFTWSFGLEAFRGEDAAGTWTVRIQDVLGGYGGTLDWVDLDLHGRAVQADDVYHYTDEFGAMARLAGQSGRTVLADADGGADWIDAAAVSGNAVVNLNAGTTSTLAGGSFAIAAGATIEHCVTGDGGDRVTGNAAANRLLGMRGNDSLLGGDGNDSLDGGTGADSMAGGAGDDTYIVDSTGDRVTELAGGGIDLIWSGVSLALAANVEVLVLTGTTSLAGTGNALANRISGNDGANRLDGRAGADTIAGGNGSDTYVVDDAGDVVIERAGGGAADLVLSGVAFALGAEVERLTLTGALAVGGTGNALANALTGNAAANLLSGGDGRDSVYGGDGADTLVGGAGADVLRGDAGADAFRLGAAAEGGDTVLDFASGVDRVEVSAAGFGGGLAAGALAAGRFARNTSGLATAPAGTGQFVHETDAGRLWWDADGTGAAAHQLVATLSGNPALAISDIAVIA